MGYHSARCLSAAEGCAAGARCCAAAAAPRPRPLPLPLPPRIAVICGFWGWCSCRSCRSRL
eukprot:2966561-Rhodomonas_salina.1